MIIPTFLLWLLAQVPQAPQEPQPAAPGPDEGWKPLNQTALVVNEKLVTTFQLQAAVERRARGSTPPVTTPQGKQKLFNQEVTERAKEMLRVQGGKDMGFDPEMVSRAVDRFLEQEKESAGTLSKLGEELAKDEKDRFTREDEVYSWVYSQLWHESVVGKTASQGGRPSHDRYVRPGRVWFEYRDLPAPPAEVQLTQLIVTPEKDETMEQAQARLEDYRQRVLAGEDMGKLADDFGSTKPGTRGLSDYIPESSLQRLYPDIHAFLQDARPGDLSEVFPYKGERQGWLVVRLEDRRQAAIPPFDDRAFQSRLVSETQARLDNLRSGLGLERLLQAAYVWPPDAFGSAPAR